MLLKIKQKQKIEFLGNCQYNFNLLQYKRLNYLNYFLNSLMLLQ